ncbi:VOC family protein [Phragmitibacter flavus]|uniref:VOC family protein n=1 Tax=Phragmitibacter flavus TaxID=2576071 RepID=A0A5R8KDZ0_9BACT|nr:VOC family protein [Phragmitibacter flavus]TLD70524.1 VOC family protein [Phragmitibacter flavus]
MRLNQVTVPALDIAASVQFYVGLGLKLIVSSPHYARFECPDGESTFSVHLSQDKSSTGGVVVYFECPELDHKVEELKAMGYSFISGPKDEPWLWREARLQDPTGNAVCIYWAGVNRRHPPWRLNA